MHPRTRARLTEKFGRNPFEVFAEDAQRGLGPDQIADRHDEHRNSVRRWLAGAGICCLPVTERMTFILGDDPEKLVRHEMDRGNSVSRVAGILGISESTVLRIARDAGFSFAIKRKEYPMHKLNSMIALGDDPIKTIRDMAAEGYGAVVIAAAVGVTVTTVRKWADMSGITIPAKTDPSKVHRPTPTITKAVIRAREAARSTFLYQGNRVVLVEAAKSLGLTPEALRWRINNWGVDRAMKTEKYGSSGKTPPRPDHTHPWFREKQQAVTNWKDRNNIV